VEPLYLSDRFALAGTDKSNFYARVGLLCGGLLLLVLLAYEITELVQKLTGRAPQTASRARLSSAGRAKGNRRRTIADVWRELYGRIGTAGLFGALWTVSLLLSFFCSRYRGEALWGARGWYMGLLPELMGTAAFFLFAYVYDGPRMLPLILLPTLAAESLLGILSRFRLGVVPSEDPTKLATIGNMNWYCGYLATLMFAAAVLLWGRGSEKEICSAQGSGGAKGSGVAQGSGGKQKALRTAGVIFLTITSLLSFMAMMIQGSASGILALAAAFMGLWGISRGDLLRMQRLLELLFLFFLGAMLLWTFCYFGDGINYRDSFADFWTRTPVGAAGMVVTGMAIAYCRMNGSADGKVQSKSQPAMQPKRGMQSNPAVRTKRGKASVSAADLVYFSVLGAGLLIALVLGIYILTVRITPGWGSNRGATWYVGWQIFLQQDFLHKLVGVGPDCFFPFLRDGAAEWLERFSDQVFDYLRLTNAHNEYLTLLANGGILGCVSFAGLMGTGIFRLLRAGRRGNVPAACCGICLLAYTANNLVSFRTALTLPLMYLLLGLGEYYLGRGSGDVKERTRK
jgi:hypothetical protein